MKENNPIPVLENRVVFYRKDRSVLFLIMAIIHLSIFAIPNDFSLIHLPIPIVLIAFAVSSYGKVALSFAEGKLEHRAIFGPTVKVYRYAKISDFLISKQSLYVIKKGKANKICSIWLLDKKSLSKVNIKKA